MKYYKLHPDHKKKSCFLANNDSSELRKRYYNGELTDNNETLEVTINSENREKYLPMKNVMYCWGFRDSYVVDESTMMILKQRYHDYLKFIDIRIIDDEKYADNKFYALYYNKLIPGLDVEKSVIKSLNTDQFVLADDAELFPVFKFSRLKTYTFVDEDFKNYVEENHIEGWIFREAFEK